MRSFTASEVVSIAALSSCSLAALTVPISKPSRQPGATISPRSIFEKRDTGEQSLFHNTTDGGGFYLATVSLGTPPQELSLILDTGSADTWVLAMDTDLCVSSTVQAETDSGCQTPFNYKKSSSFSLNSTLTGLFQVSYGDNSFAYGDFAQDNMKVGDSTIKNLLFGLPTSANSTQGLIGIGYTINEGTVQQDPSFTYPSILDTMVAQDIIPIPAYSMYLDDLDSSTGSIIFGGLDKDKFQGSLEQLKIVAEEQPDGTTIFRELRVQLTAFEISDSVAGTSNNIGATSLATSTPVVVDSGSAFTTLSMDIYLAAVKELGGIDTGGGGPAVVDCDLINSQPGLTFDYSFSATSTVKVPVAEIVIAPEKLGFGTSDDILAQLQQGGLTPTFKTMCIMGLLGGEEPFILGDTFMRSAYVVYDLQNNLIGMAQTNFNSTQESIVDFTASQTALPSVQGVSTTPAVTAVASPTASGTTSGTTTKPTGAAGRSVGSLNVEWMVVMGASMAMAVVGGGMLML